MGATPPKADNVFVSELPSREQHQCDHGGQIASLELPGMVEDVSSRLQSFGPDPHGVLPFGPSHARGLGNGEAQRGC